MEGGYIPNAMPILHNRKAMRALYYAIPEKANDIAELEWGPDGLFLRLLHQAGVMYSELSLRPGAFEANSLQGQYKVTVLAQHLRGALSTCIREGRDEEEEATKIEFRSRPNGLDVFVLRHPNRAHTRLSIVVDSSVEVPDLPDFKGAPAMEGLPFSVLYDGLTALKFVEMDYAIISIRRTGLRMESTSRVVPVSFTHESESETKEGNSRIFPPLLEEIAQFGAVHGVRPNALDLTLLDDSMMRFSYRLDHGDMTYWVSPAQTAD